MPLSVAVSTILSVLIGKFLSLSSAGFFFIAITAIWLVVLGRELLQLRRSGKKMILGWRPHGTAALMLAFVWIVLTLLSLVDFQRDQQLFTSLFTYDHCSRVNWIQSIARTGVPPANPIYFYKHAVTMRNYYFWYVLCAAVVQFSNLPARAVLNASCVWSGFALVSLIGLYLKHFLDVGVRLRGQFLLAISLMAVTGLDIFANLWEILYLHLPVHGDLELWSYGPIYSWYSSLLWVPHHVASMVCCMFAFLLACKADRECVRGRIVIVILIASALASAFGLSIFVAFGFFLLMLAWGLWQIAIERTPRSPLLMAAGGVGAAVPLLPYLFELMRSSSNMQGGKMFGLALREMIPPESLLATRLFYHLASGYPLAARTLADFVLLVPGYAIELGFYFAVFLICIIPAWRGRTPLTLAQRNLVFIAVATFPIISLIRSWVLESNDFGTRTPAFMQFALLLMASEFIVAWRTADRNRRVPASPGAAPYDTPRWLRSTAYLAIGIGVVSCFFQALDLRFVIPISERNLRAGRDPNNGNYSHKAYISAVGYAELDASIPRNAIVQFNPNHKDKLAIITDVMGVDHQIAINVDKEGCGAELGGDPSGCPAMSAAIDSLFIDATADQARTTCRLYAIQYLVVRMYDPVWKDKQSWVWTLHPVVSDDEFRALDCSQ